MPGCVRVEHVTVRPDRVIAEIRIANEACAFTSPDIIEAALRRYPHLLEHACVNDCGKTFGAVASCTSVPHLIEHMAIEEQARSSRSEKKLFVGKTSWLDRMRLLAQVEVSYEEDFSALAALRTAVQLADELLAAREADSTRR